MSNLIKVLNRRYREVTVEGREGWFEKYLLQSFGMSFQKLGKYNSLFFGILRLERNLKFHKKFTYMLQKNNFPVRKIFSIQSFDPRIF